MVRPSHILLVAALSVGPGMLSAQTDQAAGPDKKEFPKEERHFGPPPPGPDGKPPGDWGRGRGNREGGRDGRDGREGRGPRNPMEDFRRLLAMSSEERELDLANKPPGFRDMLLAKLKEYDALTPEQQELRIRSTELRFDMMYLLRASPERRSEKLERMPEDRRKLAEARLEQWDKLPEELKQDVLEHQSTLSYVVRVEAAPAAAKEDVFASMSPEYREKVKSRIEVINGLPKEKRNEMLSAFHKLFDFSDGEQQEILVKLNQAEREKVEKKLAEFEKLSPEDRRKCMDSAHKFNNLTANEQAKFMEAAERWGKMSEEERNTWRNLIKQMPMPPLPPGAKPPGSVPPLPEPPLAPSEK